MSSAPARRAACDTARRTPSRQDGRTGGRDARRAVRRAGACRAALLATALGGLGAGLLTGCAAPPASTPAADAPTAALPATVPRYTAPPAGQPSARVLLRGSVGPGERFALLRLDDAEQCQRPQMLTEGNTTQTAPAAVTVAAGALTTLDFVVLRAGNNGCGVRWSFTPQNGRSYLVQGTTVGAGCTARVVDVTVPDRPLTPPDAVLRSSPGNRCLSLAQARQQGQPTSLIQGGRQGNDAVLNPRATARDLEGLIQP